MTWKVVRKGETSASAGLPGTTERILVGHHSGAVHLEVSEVTVAGQAEVPGHRHPFEESFYVLEGTGVVTIGTSSYEVTAHDFGLVPLGVPHAWTNLTDQPLQVLRVRAPQPRQMRGADPNYLTGDATPQRSGRVPPRAVAAPHRPVGRFESSQLPPPGPLNMKGYRGPRIGRGVDLDAGRRTGGGHPSHDVHRGVRVRRCSSARRRSLSSIRRGLLLHGWRSPILRAKMSRSLPGTWSSAVSTTCTDTRLPAPNRCVG